MDLNGTIALVTGAADGIGAGIAERLAAEGMHVVIADPDDGHGQPPRARVRGGQGGRDQVHCLPGAAAGHDGGAGQFVADDGLAGRIMLCRQGGEAPRLLPVTDGQSSA